MNDIANTQLIPPRIVLVEPSHPGNIGAAARVMKNMGLRELVLVNPKRYPSADATAMAAGADDLLAGASVVTSMAEALEGATFVVASSARDRRISLPVWEPREGMARVVERASRNEVALVFGRERTGLSNDELALCHAIIQVPTEPSFSSLNLAAAVQIFCYEFRLAKGYARIDPAREQIHTPADAARMAGFFDHLQHALLDIRFLHPDKTDSMMSRLRRLFQRAEPDDDEINILRGILAATQKQASRDQED